MRHMRCMLNVGAVLSCIALALLVAAPLSHGLIHPDHALLAALQNPDGPQQTSQTHHHGHPARNGTDCALFQAYAGHGGQAAIFQNPVVDATYAITAPPALTPVMAPGEASWRATPIRGPPSRLA